MKLSDLIIEHGPYVAGGAMPFPIGPTGHPVITATEVNELREELMAARRLLAGKCCGLGQAQIPAVHVLGDDGRTCRQEHAAAQGDELMAARAARELGERFLVYSAPISRRRGAQIGISHRGCPENWWAEVDDFSGLAELNQRAGEHAEVCR